MNNNKVDSIKIGSIVILHKKMVTFTEDILNGKHYFCAVLFLICIPEVIKKIACTSHFFND